jgi:hypothetical protein
LNHIGKCRMIDCFLNVIKMETMSNNDHARQAIGRRRKSPVPLDEAKTRVTYNSKNCRFR